MPKGVSRSSLKVGMEEGILKIIESSKGSKEDLAKEIFTHLSGYLNWANDKWGVEGYKYWYKQFYIKEKNGKC